MYPAVTTNFTAQDELDLPLFNKNLQFQIDAGVDGIVLAGSLGEASTITLDEKERLVKSAVETAAGKVRVEIGFQIGDFRLQMGGSI